MQPIGCHTNKIIIIIISGTTRPGIFTNFLVHVTYTAVARSSPGSVAISLNMGKVVQSRRTLALQKCQLQLYDGEPVQGNNEWLQKSVI